MRILQVANYKKGVGGISVQVELLQKKLREEGFCCDILSTTGSIPKRIKAVFQLLTTGSRYDVFHIHACSRKGFFPAIIGVIAGRLLRKRTVLTYHGGGAEPFFQKRERLVRFILSRSSANIALSGFIGSIFDRYGLDYTIIPNIIELDGSRFRLREIVKPRFISIRSLYKTYNIECTLRAFQRVQSNCREATLTIVGDGPQRADLEEFVRSHGITGVSFVGQVSNESIYSYLDDADIMVSSSRSDNMPVSVLEGFNAGLLVVASAVGGVPYMIHDGENGYLFSDDNDVQMSERMMDGFMCPEKTNQLILNARDSLAQYQWTSSGEKILALYQG